MEIFLLLMNEKGVESSGMIVADVYETLQADGSFSDISGFSVFQGSDQLIMSVCILFHNDQITVLG